MEKMAWLCRGKEHLDIVGFIPIHRLQSQVVVEKCVVVGGREPDVWLRPVYGDKNT
jgi:hypothetical protein